MNRPTTERSQGFVRKEYSAGAVKHLFWFMEFRKVVRLLFDGLDFAEIERMNREENIFCCSTRERSKEIFKTVSSRISTLNESFYPVFMRGDLSTQKLFALIAVMAYDTLFFDLVYECVREQFLLGTGELKDSDIRIFFHHKQQQSEKVAKWTEGTIKNLMTCYKSILYEAGLTNKKRNKRNLFKPILEHEIQEWLEQNGFTIMIAALTGV